MKKTTITFLTAGLIIMSAVKAQTIQEGMGHLYAGRIKNATSVFEKLLAVNPNNIDAMYWLGQTKLEGDEIMTARVADARKVYEKGLQTTNGAPLIKAGMGHVELLAGNTDAARQHFETALTMTRGKKGDDPIIETAIGRGITDAKGGDFKYAVRLLEDAVAKDPKNTETLLQLGNAYRKAGEGSGGGQAFTTYNKALEVNPAFAVASLRLAKLFESQKNWDLVLKYLNDATTKDPKFTAGYYELFYYYFFRAKYEEAESYLKKYIDSKLPESDLSDQFLYGQLCYVRKDLDCAITKAESIVANQGNSTKPRVYRLLAYAYYDKGDFANAKKYSDLFFVYKNPDDYVSNDHKLRADIMSQTGGSPDEIYVNYTQGAELDTVVADKITFLKKGATYFKDKKIRDKEALLLQKIIELKPKPTINDYFDLTLAHYFSNNYIKSRETALLMRDIKYPEEVYGYDWAFKVSSLVDSLKQDSIAVPDALKLHDFAQKDTSKFKKQYISAVRFLAAYYINKAKDKAKSIEFFKKWQSADAANASMIQGYIDAIEKSPAPKPGTKPATGGAATKGTGKTATPPAKTKTTKTKPKTTSLLKNAVVKLS